MNIDIIPEKINAIYAMGTHFTLMVNEKMYEAKSVIIEIICIGGNKKA